MEKVLFVDVVDGDYQEYFVVLDMKDFVLPRKGDIVQWMGMSFRVDGCVHNYDKKQILVGIQPTGRK